MTLYTSQLEGKSFKCDISESLIRRIFTKTDAGIAHGWAQGKKKKPEVKIFTRKKCNIFHPEKFKKKKIQINARGHPSLIIGNHLIMNRAESGQNEIQERTILCQFPKSG